VAFIVSVIEILATVYRLVRSKTASDVSAKDFVLKVE
jgi:multisubunit Na+/H+ antiporter MnhF subunit